jgi:hypothetical protein
VKAPAKIKHVVVRFRGTLGNQLFQYWTGYAVARRLEAGLWYEPGTPPLELFPVIDMAPASVKVLEETLGPSGWKGTAVRAVQRVWPARCRRYQAEKFGAFRDGPLKVASSCFLDGYWQSFRYFADLESQDFESLRLKIAQLAGETPSIDLAPQSVVVHIDHARHRQMGVALPDAFYSQAIDRWAERPVLVVTDDPEFCLKVLADRPHVTIVSGLEATPWQLLHLLISAGAVVAANSNLSWWGAFLNRRPEQIVVPNGWLAPDLGFVYDLDDLYPRSWMRIG